MTLALIAPLALALQTAPAAAPASTTPASPASPTTAGPTTASPTTASPSAPPTSWYLPSAAPVPVTPVGSEGVPESPDDNAVKYRRLVFSNFYALNFGIYPIPSGDFSFFLGTNLRPRRSSLGKDWNTAIGYQLTLSVGGADFNYGETEAVQAYFNDDFESFLGPLFYHRHALLAQGLGGRKGRFYYAMGGGAVMWRTLLVGIEGEARFGYAFWARESSRVKGIFGGQVRLGGPFDGAPLPQFGLFIGFMVF